MKAIVFDRPGGTEVLRLAEVADPVPGPGELLVRVHAAGVNRADLMQREGNYPPPPGASEILGLECAGVVVGVGPSVKQFGLGDRVMALLPGGGYAELATVDERTAVKIPPAMSFEEAAALPEAALTAFLNLFMLAQTKSGDSVLLHGGGSGVGTVATVLLKLRGVRVLVTAGSDEKCQKCLRLGADVAINYKAGPFAPKVKEATDGRGVDVILDHIGAAYLAPNLEVLAPEGRLVIISLMKGAKAEINLAAVLRRHLRIFGSTLRSRSAAEKGEIIDRFIDEFGADLEAGRIKAPIHEVIPLEQAGRAHQLMQASEHFGKLVLRVRDSY